MKLRIALAQANFLVGDIEGNAQRILDLSTQAREALGADVIVFPELAISGYPPEDLLYRNDFYQRVDKALSFLGEAGLPITIICGYPGRRGGSVYNIAGVLRPGKAVQEYFKHELPNYSVFDEKRYFTAGNEALIIDVNGLPVGISICEDAWYPSLMLKTVAQGAKLIVNLSASPFQRGKISLRETVIRQRIHEHGVPVVYVNLVGAQDELVFDGGSFVMSAAGTTVARAPMFEEDLALVEFEWDPPHVHVSPARQVLPLDTEASVYAALVLAVRDYIGKNGFKGVVLGLSGGIDSALTLAIAVDALGPDRVRAVSMPSRFTAAMSIDDARTQAKNLGVLFDVVSIENSYNTLLADLAPLFQGQREDATEENIQARIRGVLLMALSNKFGWIVLTTGNKSEVAVGYCTLYGDMVGGYGVLKDVPKTEVYRLAHYRNSLHPVIPERVFTRPPSAELRPDQTDQDSLPAYETLDAILEFYVEQDLSLEDIVQQGFDESIVRDVIRRVDANEYKRRQAAPGVKITARAFGRDRRYPITSGFRRRPRS